MCVLTINEADASCISQFGPLFVKSLVVFECIQRCVCVSMLRRRQVFWGLLCFGCVCVCCGSAGCDCPFLCPEVT